jgi:hypothetical protein
MYLRNARAESRGMGAPEGGRQPIARALGGGGWWGKDKDQAEKKKGAASTGGGEAAPLSPQNLGAIGERPEGGRPITTDNGKTLFVAGARLGSRREARARR